MAINKSLPKIIIGLFLLGGVGSVYAGTQMWTFSPLTPTTVTVAEGATASVQYSVQNQSLKPKRLAMLPIPGVTQTSPCVLAPRGHEGSSCVLDLAVNGSAISRRGVHGGPALCQTNADGNPNPTQCYRPSPGNELNITKNATTVLFLATVGTMDEAMGGDYFPVSYTSSDNGDNWIASATLPPAQVNHGGLESIRCGTSGQCVAVGFANNPISYVSNDKGVSWVTSAVQPVTQNAGTTLASVACDRVGNHCVAVGVTFTGVVNTPASYISNDAGNTWAISATQPSQLGEIRSIDCDATGNHCVTVGTSAGDPISYVSNDGGNIWSASAVSPPPVSGGSQYILNSVDCNAAGTHCVAVGYVDLGYNFPLAYVSNDGGNTWGPSVTFPLAPMISEGLLSVSCDDVGNHCVAVGLSSEMLGRTPLSYVSNDGGSTWTKTSPPAILDSLSQFVGVYCDPAAGQVCAAIGYYTGGDGDLKPASLISNDGGNTWTVSQTMPPALMPSTQLQSISGAAI